MDTVNIFGTIALVITLVYTCFGMPAQIWHNYAGKSTAGLSFFMMLMSFFTFVAWVAYAAIKPQPDYYLLSSNIPGALFTGTIMVQFFLYRGRGR